MITLPVITVTAFGRDPFKVSLTDLAEWVVDSREEALEIAEALIATEETHYNEPDYPGDYKEFFCPDIETLKLQVKQAKSSWFTAEN